MPIKEHYSTKHFKGNYIKYNSQHSHLLAFASFFSITPTPTPTQHTLHKQKALKLLSKANTKTLPQNYP